MANKTVRIIDRDLTGKTGLKAILKSLAGAPINGSGDNATETATGVFEATVAAAVADKSWYIVDLFDGGGANVWRNGWVYFPTDAVGVYIVDDPRLVPTVTAKLDTTLEVDGSVYRFTANALEQAPSTPIDVNAIAAATSILVIAGLAPFEFTPESPLDTDSQELRLIQRDDYVTSNGRSLKFRLSSAFPVGDTVLFGAKTRDDVPINGEGTIDEDDEGKFVTIDLDSDELDRLPGGWDYSLTHVNGSGKRHTFANEKLWLEEVQT